MKKTGIFLIFACAAAFVIASPSHAGPKWKGYWYLRGAVECKEIQLDKKGRTVMGVYPQCIVEKKDKDYFLTVQSMGKKYSYAMNDMDKVGYDLDLLSVGPNLPVPTGRAAQDAYTAIFRKMVDCQETMPGGVKETTAR